MYNAISTNNANLPGGRIDKPTVETTVSVHAEINEARDLAVLPVSVPGGAQKMLQLGALATVSDSHQEQRLISKMNGANGLILAGARNCLIPLDFSDVPGERCRRL